MEPETGVGDETKIGFPAMLVVLSPFSKPAARGDMLAGELGPFVPCGYAGVDALDCVITAPREAARQLDYDLTARGRGRISI